MSYRSPLGKVLGLGVHAGSGHWLQIKLTSVAMVLWSIWFLRLALFADWSYDAIISTLHRPGAAIPMALGILLGMWHSYLGVRVVIEDYVHQHAIKLMSLVALQLLHITVAVTGLVALLKIYVESAL